MTYLFESPPVSAQTTEWLRTAIFAPLNISKVANHWHFILLSAAACQFIKKLSSTYSPKIFKETYPRLSYAQKINWDLHWVSMVHCVVIVAGAFAVWGNEELKRDRVFGYDTMGGNVYSVATGYFLWDAITSLRYIKELGAGFFIHGIVCFFVFLFAYKPFLMYYGSAFLMFELSTPFLNINWFMDKMGLTGSTLQLVNGICLLVSFFSARIVFGAYASYLTCVDVKAVQHLVPTYLLVFFTVADAILTILNFYWFAMMIRALQRRFSGKPHKRSKKLDDELDPKVPISSEKCNDYQLSEKCDFQKED